MNIPADPTLADLTEALAEFSEVVAENIHLTAGYMGRPHLTPQGERVEFAHCPNDPCRTWLQVSSLWARWQAGRLP